MTAKTNNKIFPINEIPKDFTGVANVIVDNFTVQLIEIWKAEIVNGRVVEFIELIDIEQH